LILFRCFCFMTRGLHRHKSIMRPAEPSTVRFARRMTGVP
jgi:hypothetical protein